MLATACPTVNFKLKDPACTSHTLQVFDQQHTGYDFLGYYHTGKKFVTKDRTSGNTCASQTKGAGGSVPVLIDLTL